MLRITTTFFNLDKIAESGQCFRWKKTGEQAYEIPAYGKTLNIKQEGNDLYLDCTQAEYDEVWRDYFDLNSDYEQYEQELRSRSDTSGYLYEATKAARGIRILKQELWEVIASFIISQNNNIPRIKGCIERLCERFEGFPGAKQILDGGMEKLDGLGLGYRQQYILGAALLYHGNGDGNTERELRSLDYKEAVQYLSRWLGIGPKVANCICLFGLGHKEVFPRDVWVKRIEAEHFGGRFPEENYPGYAGVLQQYIFFYERSRKNGGN